MKFVLFLIFVCSAFAQTRVRPEQLPNIEQIRICWNCGDDRVGTLVLTNQINPGAIKLIPVPTPFTAPEDQGVLTICIVNYFRVSLQPPPPVDWPAHNIKQYICYSQLGLQQLLTNPLWQTWWDQH